MNEQNKLIREAIALGESWQARAREIHTELKDLEASFNRSEPKALMQVALLDAEFRSLSSCTASLLALLNKSL